MKDSEKIQKKREELDIVIQETMKNQTLSLSELRNLLNSREVAVEAIATMQSIVKMKEKTKEKAEGK